MLRDTKKINKSVDKFLHTDIKIRGIVKYIGTDKLILTAGPNVLCCDLRFDIPEIRLEDAVNMIIQLEPNHTDFLNYKIIVKFICKSDSKWKKSYAAYKSFGETTEIVDRWHSRDKIPHKKVPQIIRSIGLIVVGHSGPTFVAKNNFKRKFESDCNGTLYIYNVVHISKRNDLAHQFINAFQLFSNYHEIDIICVLAPNLDQSSLFALSNSYVMKNILAVGKSRPYVVSIQNKTQVTYAVTRLFDRVMQPNQIIRLINETQDTFKTRIDSAIRTGTTELHDLIKSNQSHSFNLESMLTDFFSEEAVRVDVSAALTQAAVRLLDQKLAQLTQLELDLANTTLDLIKKSDPADIAWHINQC